MSEKLIDIEKVIADKNPRLLKQIPGFLISYLKRIVHQEEINDFIDKHRKLTSGEFSDCVMEYFNIDVQLHQVEHAPKKGGIIFASNHPLGGLDALAVVHKFRHHRPDIKFIVNDLLLHLTNLQDLFVGVNKHGATAKSSLKTVDELFHSDKAVFVFPAGLVSRKRNGRIRDLEWKKTFVTRARKYRHPIVPVHIDGGLSNFFYRLANLRTGLGIKANLEMLYLANEQFKQRDKTINITFGKLIDPEQLDKNRNNQQWAKEIREIVYTMPDQ